MITLHFDHEAIEALLLHSHESLFRTLSPSSHADDQNCFKEMGTRDEIPAGLHLVKQHSVFLQSNGISCWIAPLLYARGYDPAVNTHWYMALSSVLSDDFAVFLPAQSFSDALKQARDVVIILADDRVRVI